MKAIIGKKIGMTQVFSKDGTATPVTVIEAGPCIITQLKNTQRDGYEAVQIGFGDVKASRVTKPAKGHFKKANTEVKKNVKEFRVDTTDSYTIGDAIKCDVFAEGDIIDVSGMTKGHGFTGVIKRWNNSRLKMTHGTGPVHREVGSMGANSTPSRVFKNKKMAGQWGNEKATIQGLKVVRIDAERNLILVKGSVPGARNCIVTLTASVKA